MPENKKTNLRNLLFLVTTVVIFIITFILVFNIYKKEGEKRSVYIETPSSKTDHIEIYAYIVSIDPIKGDMNVRLYFEPKGTLANEKGYLNEEIDLYVNSATGKQEYSFGKDKIINPLEVTLSLYDGLVTDYPLDNHKTELIFSTTSKENKDDTTGNAREYGIENVLNFSGSVTGYKITAEQDSVSNEYYTILNIAIERADSVKFFSFFVIIIMWLLILLLSSLLYAILFKGRKIEINMFTFSSAMLFAFPAFRNMMPFAPPIGAFPDYVAFFWAEAAAALTLITLIFTWIVRKQN